MTLNAGDTGYGSVPGSGLSASVGGTETAPLFIPEPEPEPDHQWQPLTKEELEAAAGGPVWRRVRWYLVLLFWLACVAMLATGIAIVAMSPRPVAIPLKWWQKTVFYELKPKTYMEVPQGLNALLLDAFVGKKIKTMSGCILSSQENREFHQLMEELYCVDKDYFHPRRRKFGPMLFEQLPYLKSLGIGTLILQGLLDKEDSASNLTVAAEGLGTLPQIQHLLTESNKAGLKVMVDLCGLDPNDAGIHQSHEQHSLRFWLDQGVAGFVICDTDVAYSEKTLLEWRDVLMEFGSQEEERIVMVKETQHDLLPLTISDQINKTLVDVVMRSILPYSHHLTAQEVADAIETHLQTKDEKLWPSWTVGGEASHDLKKLLLVLTMTLPGSPALHYDEDMDRTQDKRKEKRSAVALFTSLSHSRAREEALMYGSFTFLPFNNTSNSTLSSPSSPTVLAFLRSWGCVQFLILLNVGPEPHALDPAWAPSLPEAGVFVTSSGLDRLGSTLLNTLVLQAHEAIVIKLFEGGSYS